MTGILQGAAKPSPSASTRKASKRQTCLEALATSMGGDNHRVFWILKNFDESCILNPLANSSILKEWELLQVVTTFLLAGRAQRSCHGLPGTCACMQTCLTSLGRSQVAQ
jgi:hypothetical protein